MQLQDIMTRNPEFVSPDADVCEATRKMQSLNVGFLPVGDETNVVGVITDRDVVVRGVAEGRDLTRTAVNELMSERVASLPGSADVQRAAELMDAQQIRRLIVTDEADRCVGVASLGDLAVKTARHDLAGEVLEEVSEPARPNR